MDDLVDVGTDEGTRLANYGALAQFNGHLEKVTLDVHSAVLRTPDKAKEAEMHQAKKEAE